MAACEDASEAQAKKARTGPCTNPRKTPREIAKLANPGLVARLANSVRMLEGSGEEWWGWVVTRDTVPGDPEALPRALPPPSTQPCRPSATSASPESARRTLRSQRDDERHRDTKPAQCANAGLKTSPGKHSVTADPHLPKKRPSVFRRLPLLRTWFCLLLVLSSPGSKIRTDAAPFPCTVSGHFSQGTRHSIAPGDESVDLLARAVPTLRCSEHAKPSMQSSRKHQAISSSQRGCCTHVAQEGTHTCLSWIAMVPGTHSMCMNPPSEPPMSDTQCLSGHKLASGTPLSHDAVYSGLTLPGMSHAQQLFYYICSHVGYTSQCIAECPTSA